MERKEHYCQLFEQATEKFETMCGSLTHQRCDVCQIVSMQNIFKKDNLCKNCASGNKWTQSYTEMLPVWKDDFNNTQFFVPECLTSLTEGEKLLIQQISVYVPLHHLKYGQLGVKGHIVSFPQDISEICKELPRLPTNVSFVRVVKHFKLSDGEISSKSFMIRKKNVLDALNWLKKYNVLYADIHILEENLDWIDNGKEQQLPASILEESVDESILRTTDEDRGPAEQQITTITDEDKELEPSYGTVRDFNPHVPKVKDSPVIDTILDAEKRGRPKTMDKKRKMDFPYVSPDPICEYTERHLFEKAFPWLFPGGTGGYESIKEPKPNLADWMEKTILYNDGRFAKDKMWAFCAVNFFARHTNQTSGGFFVETFFKQGPKTLEDLQDQLAEGNMSWLNSISYFSHRVTGSTAYWRARRNEVFSWINYHLEQGHGPPSFFITLSCAEYHWKDIHRLIIDRCEKAQMPCPDFTKGNGAIINEYAIVVQEYFQLRVQAWLDTVGKDLLHIKHHWLRFEFAPSRGQIHAHMLAICDNLEMLNACNDLKNEPTELASYLSGWMEDTLGMTASFDTKFVDELDGTSKSQHPSTVNFYDIPQHQAERDTANCQAKFQSHKCSAYCMRTRHRTQNDETPEQKLRRVCRCGAGVEQHFMKADTPGFPLREQPSVVEDPRGFDKVDLARNNKRITQSSKYLMRGWRANCDIQILIYRSAPNDINAADVSRVTNYIVSYACKGSESVVEEKKAMKSLINAAKEEDGDARDVKRMARRLLNESSKNRVISKQEALCQMAGLRLFTCSEAMEQVSLSGNTRLGTEFQGKKTFLSKYATRDSHFHHMSLDQYFHQVHNSNPSANQRDKRFKVPIYSGAQCEPVFPATPAYARGVMLIYSAWHTTFDFDKNTEHLLEAFADFIHDKTRCPHSVSVSYERARISIGMKEPLSKNNDIDYDTFSVKPDQDLMDLVELASTMYDVYDAQDDTCGIKYDYGTDFDWSQRSVEVST